MSSLSFGERIADKFASIVGSWRFIIIQSCLLAVWVVLNLNRFLLNPWDPYPFILLNLMLSFQAAYTGPILLMAQNRKSAEDSRILRQDLELDEEMSETLHDIEIKLGERN